ncbi:hypothetical protein N7523_010248 [Penicillium sp. IBT 18751x]|nr:hypothetical protein N7523_010248 [Penicillium sp. IBT 18751x]
MAAWLDVVPESSGWTLVDTGRLEKLVQSMSHPYTQFPALIYFAGNGNRIKALRALFPRNNVTRRGPATFSRLHISTETANTQHPVLFAESGLFDDSNFGESMLRPRSNEKFQRYSILRGSSCTSATARRRVMSQAILPWTHVLCLFVDTLSEMRDAHRLLDCPPLTTNIGSQTVPRAAKVIIVSNTKFDSSVIGDIVCGGQTKPVKTEDITFVDLSDRYDLSPGAAFEPLRKIVLDKLETVQAEQIQKGLSFSAVHMSALWAKTLEIEMTQPDNATLDFLQATREQLKSRSIKAQHLSELLCQAREHSCATDQVYCFIASALLMDAYPPGMHLFHPDIVFNELYRNVCENAWDPQTSASVSEFCDAISHHLSRFFSAMSPTRPSSAIRRSFLSKSFRQWRNLSSTTSCFLCLSQPPELILPCQHAICDTCAAIFGDRSKKAEYHFDISKCPLCAENFQFTTRQLPPTKRPILLSLDGGGIRGIVQLGLLRSLEKRLGEQAPISLIFDLCAGTSVGALNVMDLIINKSSADDSFRRFPKFARNIFDAPPPYPSNNKCAKWFKIFTGIFSDGQYDGEALESMLKEVLGPNRRLFDVGTTHDAGSRVAIITSRTSDGKACVLANYRGIDRKIEESAYEFLEPMNEIENPFLWEAFFQAKTLPGFGPLQDGGVRANNPLSIALKESAIVWPTKDRHDLLISVGTGFTSSKYPNTSRTVEEQLETMVAPEDRERKNNILRSFLQEGAIPRLIRATMSSPAMDGEQAFLEALNYVPEHMKANIYRLNQSLPEPLPRLDDVGKLAGLAESSFQVSDELVRALLITGFFFFELDQIPIFKQGGFQCEGSILCTSPQARDLVKRVHIEFPRARFQIARGYSLGSIDEDDGCGECGYYRKKVMFTVTSLEENVTIQVANSSFEQRLGGFPKSINELLRDQQAYAQFGRVDHLPTLWPLRRRCFCSRGTKRSVEFLEPPLDTKKRRL